MCRVTRGGICGWWTVQVWLPLRLANEGVDSLPDMTQPRDMPGTCVITGATGSKTLYAFGGAIAFPTPPNTTMTITDTVEMLAFGSDGQPANAWKPAKSLPSARTSPSVTSLADGSGCIIAAGFSVGGPYGFQYLSDAYLFDGSAYKQLPDLAYGRSNMGIAAAGDGVLLIGGGAHDPSYYRATSNSPRRWERGGK